MRVNELYLSEATFDIRRRKEGEVVFPSSTMNDPHIKRAIKMIAAQTKTDPAEVIEKIQSNVDGKSKLGERSPILYETINKNAVEQAVFEIFWKAGIKPQRAPEFDNVTFVNLARRLRNEYDEFFPLRSYIDKTKLVDPVLTVIDEDHRLAREIDTAAATPYGQFYFNREFMQSLLNYASMKGVTPTAAKYTNNRGEFPPEYAYVEFVIMHEFMHYSNDDFYYQRVIPNANPKIINWVGDFRTNYLLTKSGFEALPIGLFNDKINYDRQDEYVEMYNIVKEEFDRLSEEDRKLMEEILDGLSDDHEPGNEAGANDDKDGLPPPKAHDCPDCDGTGKSGGGQIKVGDKVVINKTGKEAVVTGVTKDMDGNVKDVTVEETQGGLTESTLTLPVSEVTKISDDQDGQGDGQSGDDGQEGDEGEGQPGGGGGDEEGDEGDGDGDGQPGKGDAGDGTCPSCNGSGKEGDPGDSDQVTPGDLDSNAKQNGKSVDEPGKGDKKGDDDTFGEIKRHDMPSDGNPGSSRGKQQDLDYSKLNPQFNWKTLIDRFIKTGLGRVEPTYSKPHRRSVTSVDVARQTGAGAIKPAEKPLEFSDAKIMFILDTSGSMGWVMEPVMATAWKLLKMPAFRKLNVLVSKFSGGSDLFKVNVASNKAGMVDTAKDMPKTWDMTAEKVMSSADFGGTTFGSQEAQNAKDAMALGYNVIMFSDMDVVHGDNGKNLVDMITSYPKQAFIIFDLKETWIEFRKKTGINTPNITYFKEAYGRD